MATFATVDVVVVIIFFSFVSSVQFLINKSPHALTTFMVFPSRTKRIWLMLTHNWVGQKRHAILSGWGFDYV
jgi:hypothetical protein